MWLGYPEFVKCIQHAPVDNHQLIFSRATAAQPVIYSLQREEVDFEWTFPFLLVFVFSQSSYFLEYFVARKQVLFCSFSIVQQALAYNDIRGSSNKIPPALLSEAC